MDLLVGITAAVAHGNHQDEQIRPFFRDLGKNLDEVERPILPGVLLAVGKAVVPGLELVQQQHRRLVLQQLDDELVGRDIGLGRPHADPFAFDEGAVGMTFKQQIPEELVTLAMEAFANHEHPVTQGHLAEVAIAQGGCPGVQPCASRCRIVNGMVERGHQMRLTEASHPDDDHWAPLVGADGLDALQQVMGRIGDLQELLGRDLSRARIRVIGKLNGRPFEALAPEFFS